MTDLEHDRQLWAEARPGSAPEQAGGDPIFRLYLEAKKSTRWRRGGTALPATDQVERLWGELGDACVDGDGLLDAPWLFFEAGSSPESIWHWFEEEFHISVSGLMYGPGAAFPLPLAVAALALEAATDPDPRLGPRASAVLAVIEAARHDRTRPRSDCSDLCLEAQELLEKMPWQERGEAWEDARGALRALARVF